MFVGGPAGELAGGRLGGGRGGGGLVNAVRGDGLVRPVALRIWIMVSFVGVDDDDLYNTYQYHHDTWYETVTVPCCTWS